MRRTRVSASATARSGGLAGDLAGSAGQGGQVGLAPRVDRPLVDEMDLRKHVRRQQQRRRARQVGWGQGWVVGMHEGDQAAGSMRNRPPEMTDTSLSASAGSVR